MLRNNRIFILLLVVMSILTFGLTGCNSNDTEAPGKKDTPEIKERRAEKEGN